MIYELIADLKRYNEDKKVNSQTVVRVGIDGNDIGLTNARSDEIVVGDIIKL